MGKKAGNVFGVKLDSMNDLKVYANLIFHEKASQPDSFDISNDIPNSNFVVSRDEDEQVISYYGDMEWDFTVYNKSKAKSSKLIFSYWGDECITPQKEELVGEMKYVMFSLIWLRDKKPLSIGTLRNYLTIIREIAKFAKFRSCSLQMILEQSKLLIEFLKSFGKSGWYIETMTSLIAALKEITYPNFRLQNINNDIIKILKKHNIQYRNSLNQHSPIPTRIYSQILLNFNNYLQNWKEISGEVMNIVKSCYELKEKLNGKRPDYDPILVKASSQLRNYVLSNTGKFTIKEISSLLTDTQAICKLVIQSFTGMRDTEAQTLPYHCIKKITSNSEVHYFICGITSKLNNGKPKLTEWVTNRDGIIAVDIARNIADIIYYIHQDIPIEKEVSTYDYPLFISTSYLGLTGKAVNSKLVKYKTGTLDSKRQLDKLIPKIETEDIIELEKIDPHRAWRSEEYFQIGSQWRLTTHQFRRSLALYAQRSGLVSLPSLKRQLQHITIEMTRYYAKGSPFAKNLIAEDKTHFAHEWQETQIESSYLSYLENVLMTNKPLYGGHAHWVEQILKKNNQNQVINREETLKRFKKGEIFFRETIMGGCTKVGECNSSAINWLQVNCLKENCRHLVVSLPKLERVITAHKNMINGLDVTSLEYRTEINYLEILEDIKQKILKFKEA